LRSLYGTFLKGLLTLLPITLTLYLLFWIASSAESAFGEPLRTWFPQPLYFPGAGMVLVIVLIFLFGTIVNNYFARRFVDWLEERLEALPVIRSIYGPLRDVTQLFAKGGQTASQRVVMVQFDSGVELMGLITREQFQDLPPNTVAAGSVTVFVPYSYGVGGMTLIVPRSRVRETAIPADKAMQLAITGWIKASK
jgi:uncharacterized membrane protein